MEYLRTDLSDPIQKQAYIEYIQSLDTEVEILHYPVSNKRSIPMNRYYRVVLKLISQESGHSVSYLHRNFKKLYALAVKTNPESRETTSDMSKTQFLEFLDMVLIWYYDFFSKDIDEEYYP